MSKKNKTMSEEITTEGVSISHFQENIKANDNLKEVLKLALKQTSTTTREVLPKLSNAVVSYIKEFKENLKNQTVTDEMMNYISNNDFTYSQLNASGMGDYLYSEYTDNQYSLHSSLHHINV